jgi:Flp pilus assembly protein TadD
MRVGNVRVVVIAAVCLVGLAACQTTSDLTGATQPGDDSLATSALPDTTGSVAAPEETAANTPELLGNDPHDDLSLAKKYFRQGGFGKAEQHFRKAVELHPRDAEAWVGLAASYDRLRRFDLADRAYRQAIKIIGQTPELLNNQGYSYMLRGDYRRARATLLAARSKDPQSPYIKANLELLEESQRKHKAIN